MCLPGQALEGTLGGGPPGVGKKKSDLAALGISNLKLQDHNFDNTQPFILVIYPQIRGGVNSPGAAK